MQHVQKENAKKRNEQPALRFSFVFIALDHLLLLLQTFRWCECNQLLTSMQTFRAVTEKRRQGGSNTAADTQRSNAEKRDSNAL